MGASHAPSSSVVPSTRLPRLKTVGKGGRGKGEGGGGVVGVLGLPTPLEDCQAMGAVDVPILLKGACGDHWSGCALLVTVWMGCFLPTYDEKNACTEAKRKSTLSDLQQLHERLHFRSGLSVTIAEFQRAKINDRRGRPSDRTRVNLTCGDTWSPPSPRSPPRLPSAPIGSGPVRALTLLLHKLTISSAVDGASRKSLCMKKLMR